MKVEVPSPHSIDHWLTPSADATTAGFEPSTSPGNLFCSFLPVVNGLPSPFKNKMNTPEFTMEGKAVHYNDNFWEGQKTFKHLKDGGKLVLMDVCAQVPEFLLRENQLAPHRNALAWMNDHGCGIGGGFLKCTFYKGYVTVLMSFLNSPIVKKARCFGFRPLFIIKNCLLARSRFGVRGMQFVTVDKDAKSSILLAGFWRMKQDDRNQLELIAIDAEGSLISHGAVFN